jgi:acetolactate synthase-1/2/3 large subunit
MKVSDYIAKFLADRGITHAFGMSGGAAVHMFDSIDRRADIEIISMTHEQCAAIAADGYARATGNVGVAICTSGPGATNLLTGTCCSFYDSIPTLMLTGQVSRPRLKGELAVRQLGFQETNVLSIFQSVTKYAVQLKDAKDIRRCLEKAFFLACEGRPGPVLIDIPDDLQRAEVDPENLIGFDAPKIEIDDPSLAQNIQLLLRKLSKAKRPVIVLGGGLKTPFVGPNLLRCIDEMGAPVLLSWAAVDLLPAEHPLRVGTFGVYGSRAGNLTVQNADLVITLGTRLSQNLTGGVLESFARDAEIVMVDVDAAEMNKFDGRGIQVGLRVQARLTDALACLSTQLESFVPPLVENWLLKILHWRQILPKDLSPIAENHIQCLDANEFIVCLSRALPESMKIFLDTGGNLTWACNELSPKLDQQVYSAWNHTPMGYSLPAAIGAAFANPGQTITCLIGDGGLMICMAELATVVKYQLPIKIFLFNNHSHGIQKQTLETWLGGRKVGVDPSSGVAFPASWTRLAEAFNIAVCTIDNEATMQSQLNELYAAKGPVFVNVEINPEQKLYPVLKFGQPLEFQLPELKNVNISDEMIVSPYLPLGKNTGNAGQGW